MESKALLPPGSVVKLHETEKEIMIMGFYPEYGTEGEVRTTKDYVGVMYPEGFISAEMFAVFNREDIAEVVFEGYRDNEWGDFQERLSIIMDRGIKEPEKKG